MTTFLSRTAVGVGLLLVAGCVTEEFVVYQESVLNRDAMKPFLGVYDVKQWPGDARPSRIRVLEGGGKFRFSYAGDGEQVQADFVMSKIPNSKRDLYLISIPGQMATNDAHLFFIGQAGKDQTRLWVVLPDLPVAKEHLTFSSGKVKTAGDLKTFLTQHGDAFVNANQPAVVLEIRKS